MKLAIYDLDGTVICSEHRYKTEPCGSKIDLQHWRENCTPELIAKDCLLPHAEQFKRDQICNNTIVAIATARVMSKADFDYIKKHLGNPDIMVHRMDNNDSRKGTDLKVTGIMANLGTVHDLENITIYEDNMTYLQGMTEKFEERGATVYPIFVQSNQGH